MNIIMPQLGETVAEGKITNWFKGVGDKIGAGEALFEIDTDKTAMEVPATSPGILKEIRFAVGETAPVGATVAVLTVDGEAPSAVEVETAVSAPAATAPLASVANAVAHIAPEPAKPAPVRLDPFDAVKTPARNFGPATLSSGSKITPLARRLAAQSGVELTTLRGSGPHGRIVARDVTEAKAETPAPVGGPAVDRIKSMFAGVPYTESAPDGMRRTIARRLVEAKQTVPHFYLSAEIGIEKLLAVRSEINAQAPVKVSINDFIVKAFAAALERTPRANAVWAEDSILQFQRVDLGVAVAVDGGLFTPVVRDASKKSISTISAEIKELAERARSRKLKPEEYQGGAASISNLGMYGVRQFAAIVNPPQATILAVGAAARQPTEAPDGLIKFESRLTVTLSCDHRVVDGALGGQLLAAFRDLMEAPLSVLV